MSAEISSQIPADQNPAADRRQRRKAETRQRILEAASRLFARQGFDATRPQDIAREADVAVGTFYLHFADRRDAFVAFTERAADDLMEHARSRVREDGSFDERLRSYLDALLDYMQEKPGVVGAAFANEAVIGAGLPDGRAREGAGSLRDRLARGLARGIELGMQRGELRADYDPQLISYAMVGLIQQALTHGQQLSLERDAVLDQITRFCARALVRPGEESR
jgi:TetR/AcrR family fatty acid metabolism transcriptional regulator